MLMSKLTQVSRRWYTSKLNVEPHDTTSSPRVTKSLIPIRSIFFSIVTGPIDLKIEGDVCYGEDLNFQRSLSNKQCI